MRKFIVYTRSLPAGCCKVSTDAPAVVEVEGEMITQTEDTSVGWLPQGEFKFRITQPEFLYESQEIKKADGSKEKVMLPPVYYSHAVYYNIYQAQVAAEHIVRSNFEFERRKTGKEFTEEEVRAKFVEIQEILL
jgi:hypothetical protein